MHVSRLAIQQAMIIVKSKPHREGLPGINMKTDRDELRRFDPKDGQTNEAVEQNLTEAAEEATQAPSEEAAG